MFYIHGRNISNKHEVLLLQVLPTIIVLSAFLGITLLGWNTAKNTVISEQIKSLQQSNNDIAISITQTFNSYQNILWGGVSLFNSSDDVTRNEWKAYFDTYDIENKYKGLGAIGYVELVRPENLNEHINKIQNSGIANYKIYPEGNRELYSSIVYIESPSSDASNAIGYDMLTDPTRKATIDKSTLSGEAAVSSRISLLPSNEDTVSEFGLIMVIPLYEKGIRPDTVEERQASVRGYVYAPFILKNIIESIKTEKHNGYGFEIYNDFDTSSQLLYQSDNYTSITQKNNIQYTTRDIDLPGTTWRLSGVVDQEIVNTALRSRPINSLWGGLIFTFFVTGFIYLLLGNRLRIIREREESNIKEAKDELIALASHQLRTPATGVKQYVGMLREGLAGKVTPTQQKLLDKAYESNERQLAIINDMLFVARADAGRIRIHKKIVNINSLINTVIKDQLNSINEHKHNIKVHLPTKNIYVNADKKYLCMAIDNLLSNAIKYTKNGGKLSISLSSNSGKAVIRVKDNGVGVSSKDKALLFEKFSRIPNELTNEVTGSGIGLYLTKKIITAHQGTIDFDSVPNKGSIVTIKIPKINRYRNLTRNS